MPSSSHRNHACDGCWRRCRYGDFASFWPNNFADAVAALWKSNPDPATWRQKDRRRLLGVMHAAKRDAWDHHTEQCPYRGETLGPAGRFRVEDVHALLRQAVGPRPPIHRWLTGHVVLEANSRTYAEISARCIAGRRLHRSYAVTWLSAAGRFSGTLNGSDLLLDIARPLAKTLNDLWAAQRRAEPLALKTPSESETKHASAPF